MKVDELILCDCHCPEHQMIFQYDDDPNWESVFVTFHLQNQTFWGRIKSAVKHIFGFKSKYGDFGEIVLQADDATIEKFQNVVDKLKSVQEFELKKTNEIHGNKIS